MTRVYISLDIPGRRYSPWSKLPLGIKGVITTGKYEGDSASDKYKEGEGKHGKRFKEEQNATRKDVKIRFIFMKFVDVPYCLFFNRKENNKITKCRKANPHSSRIRGG